MTLLKLHQVAKPRQELESLPLGLTQRTSKTAAMLLTSKALSNLSPPTTAGAAATHLVKKVKLL